MADELVKSYGSWMLLIVVLGSFVDLAQTTWIIRRWLKKRERRQYANIRAKIIVEEFDRRRHEAIGTRITVGFDDSAEANRLGDSKLHNQSERVGA